MPTGYQIVEQSKLHYLTFRVVYWIDVFSRKSYRDLFLESLTYCRNHKSLEVYGYVIMTNHIHLLVRSAAGDLSGAIRDLKKFTSKAIVEALGSNLESRREWILRLLAHAAKRQNKEGVYQLWTHENHAELIYSNNFIEQKLEYIHQNPVRAGFVQKAEDYPYSSARNYAELDAMIEIDKIDIRWKTIK
jgi:REP element-mobilizing transposase RayT